MTDCSSAPLTRITLVHQAALGDTVLLIPLIRALRKRFATGSHITIVTRTNLGQMLKMLGFVDAHACSDDREHTLWFAERNEKTTTASPAWADCDLLLSAVSNGQDAWAKNARQISTAKQIHFFEPRPPADYRAHVADWHREQFVSLELPIPELPLLRGNPDGAVLIHPGSGGEAKCWPRERFLSLGRTLKRNGIIPTFLLGEVEQARWDFHLMRELQEEFSWYLHLGLYELATKISRARLYLGNDSGVSQLAAAMGIPTLVLFGPSDDTQWSPIGPSVRIIRPASPHHNDLAMLSEAKVLDALMGELRKVS